MRNKLWLAVIPVVLLIISECGGEITHRAADSPPDTLIQEGNQLYYNGARVFLVSYGQYGEMCEDRLTAYDGRYSVPGAWKGGAWRDDPGWHWKAYLDLLSDAGLNFTRQWLYTSRTTRGASYRAGRCGDDLVGLLPWKYGGEKWKILEWDDSYWNRLREFCEYAWQRGIIVQLCLCARQYTPGTPGSVDWGWCPLNPQNNTDFSWIVSEESYYATSGEVWDGYTQQIIQKTVASVGDCGNIIFEIMNEENAHRPDWGSAVAAEITRQYAQEGKKGSVLISNNVIYPGVTIDGSHDSKPVKGKIPGIASDDSTRMVDSSLKKVGNRLEKAFAAWDRGNVGYEHKTFDLLTRGGDHTCGNHYELRLIDEEEVNLLAQYARGVGSSRN